MALNYYCYCLVSDIGGNKLNLSIIFTVKPPQADLESKKKKRERETKHGRQNSNSCIPGGNPAKLCTSEVLLKLHNCSEALEKHCENSNQPLLLRENH